MKKESNEVKKQSNWFRKVLVLSLLLSILFLPINTSGVSAQSTPIEIKATSSAQIKTTLTPETPTTSTGSATEDIRQKVREKIENIAKKPRAVVGLLAEIADSTVMVTNGNKEEMVATNANTTYVRIVNGKRTDVKFEDLVLRDFVVAMGYRNGNNVLDTTRIIAYDKNPTTTRHAVYGVVKSNTKGTLTLENSKESKNWTIKTTSKTAVTEKTDKGTEDAEVSGISVNYKVIAIGTITQDNGQTFSAVKIHIISGEVQSPQQ